MGRYIVDLSKIKEARDKIVASTMEKPTSSAWQALANMTDSINFATLSQAKDDIVEKAIEQGIEVNDNTSWTQIYTKVVETYPVPNVYSYYSMVSAWVSDNVLYINSFYNNDGANVNGTWSQNYSSGYTLQPGETIDLDIEYTCDSEGNTTHYTSQFTGQSYYQYYENVSASVGGNVLNIYFNSYNDEYNNGTFNTNYGNGYELSENETIYLNIEYTSDCYGNTSTYQASFSYVASTAITSGTFNAGTNELILTGTNLYNGLNGHIGLNSSPAWERVNVDIYGTSDDGSTIKITESQLANIITSSDYFYIWDSMRMTSYVVYVEYTSASDSGDTPSDEFDNPDYYVTSGDWDGGDEYDNGFFCLRTSTNGYYDNTDYRYFLRIHSCTAFDPETGDTVDVPYVMEFSDGGYSSNSNFWHSALPNEIWFNMYVKQEATVSFSIRRYQGWELMSSRTISNAEYVQPSKFGTSDSGDGGSGTQPETNNESELVFSRYGDDIENGFAAVCANNNPGYTYKLTSLRWANINTYGSYSWMILRSYDEYDNPLEDIAWATDSFDIISRNDMSDYYSFGDTISNNVNPVTLSSFPNSSNNGAVYFELVYAQNNVDYNGAKGVIYVQQEIEEPEIPETTSQFSQCTTLLTGDDIFEMMNAFTIKSYAPNRDYLSGYAGNNNGFRTVDDPTDENALWVLEWAGYSDVYDKTTYYMRIKNGPYLANECLTNANGFTYNIGNAAKVVVGVCYNDSSNYQFVNISCNRALNNLYAGDYYNFWTSENPFTSESSNSEFMGFHVWIKPPVEIDDPIDDPIIYQGPYSTGITSDGNSSLGGFAWANLNTADDNVYALLPLTISEDTNEENYTSIIASGNYTEVGYNGNHINIIWDSWVGSFDDSYIYVDVYTNAEHTITARYAYQF